MNFLIIFLSLFVYMLLYCYLFTYGSWHSIGLAHIICAFLLLLRSLKPLTSMLVHVALKPPTSMLSVWVLMTFPTPAINAPERLAFTIARAVAERVGTDVFVSFFTNFLFLVLYYLQLKVGSYLFSGLAHLLCLILLYLENVAPRKRIMVATVMVLTIVISSEDHPSKILYKFVMLVTIVPTCVVVGVAVIIIAIVISSEQLNRNIVRPVRTFIFADRNLDDGGPINNIRNEMIAPTTGHPDTVFGRLNSQEGFVTQMCVMEADNAEHPTDEMIAPTTARPSLVN